MKKARQRQYSALQREQTQLLKIEKYIVDLLAKVNESLNTLKVEELQLKSNAVSNICKENGDDERPCTSAQALANGSLRIQHVVNNPNTAAINVQLDSNTVNQQELNLSDLLMPLKKRFPFEDEEEEDEDDEEDEED